MSNSGIIIGLQMHAYNLQKKIEDREIVIKQLKTKAEQLEKMLCPECKKKFMKVFGNSQR